jgi:hypothetical protein
MKNVEIFQFGLFKALEALLFREIADAAAVFAFENEIGNEMTLNRSEWLRLVLDQILVERRLFIWFQRFADGLEIFDNSLEQCWVYFRGETSVFVSRENIRLMREKFKRVFKLRIGVIGKWNDAQFGFDFDRSPLRAFLLFFSIG